MSQEISDRLYQALEKLASSRWGLQGMGSISNANLWMELVHRGWARPVIGQEKKILSLTLRGFRVLEEERWNRKIFKGA